VIAIGAVALGKQPNGLAGLLYSWTGRSGKGVGATAPVDDSTASDTEQEPVDAHA
jgi:hypothetical protein